jgi:glycosyltransferase involved in cell wall biosynthesis
MKVLYFTYPTAFNFFGGGEIQLLKTKEYIEKVRKDCYIKLFDLFQDKLDQYEILHNFSMSSDCLSLCKMAKMKNVKIAISPIFWSIFVARSMNNFRERLKVEVEGNLVKFKNFYDNLTKYRLATLQTLYPYKEFLDLSDIILPNSNLEAILLSNMFRIRREKFHVVPNGVDKIFLKAKPDLFIQKYGLENFILFVGRLEQRKNVLTLIEACKNIGVPLVIIGHHSVQEYEYYKLVKQVADSNPDIYYLGFFPPHSEELLSAYAAAKVFVLPSWFETPGLSALEAGLAGCNVVITNRGSTTEYFKDLVSYIDPSSSKDVRSKILGALEKPKTQELRELILNNYTWEKVAEETLEAYNSIMKR